MEAGAGSVRPASIDLSQDFQGTPTPTTGKRLKVVVMPVFDD